MIKTDYSDINSINQMVLMKPRVLLAKELVIVNWFSFLDILYTCNIIVTHNVSIATQIVGYLVMNEVIICMATSCSGATLGQSYYNFIPLITVIKCSTSLFNLSVQKTELWCQQVFLNTFLVLSSKYFIIKLKTVFYGSN